MKHWTWIPALCSVLSTSAMAGPNSARDWAAMADDVQRRPELAGPLASLVASARKIAERPIAKRVYAYADIGKDRTWLDGRAKFMDGQPRQTWFGLAMSDFGTSGILLAELPPLALAYRCTKDEALRARVLAQLAETASWSPLQRSGWQLCTPAPDPVPADYCDGSWLATGTGLRAITTALALMPAGSVPADLAAKLADLLRREIKLISDDWRLHHGWFRGGKGYPQTNQWVLPTEGLILACLAVGKKQCAAEYELGVTNLLRALDVQGQNGEFNEGIGYAMFTVGSMVSAAHAMAAAGDQRALDHPFLRGFATWAVHHLQPGRYRVNCFDAGGAKSGRTDGGARELFATLAVFTGAPAARFALSRVYDGPGNDLVGLLARTLTGPVPDLPPFAAYDGPARRVNWRDSWDDASAGVWVRGGHPLDSHDHFDRGHVNYIGAGVPLLIEAGTPGYDNPRMGALYSSVVGHNVLEVTGLPARRAPAPITVARLDANGGDVTVEPTANYPGLKLWRRQVTWERARLVVADQVDGVPGKPASLCFRWHLGTQAAPEVSGEAGRWTVRWPAGELRLVSSAAARVAVEMLPDNTVCLGKKDNGWDYLHACVVVRTAEPVPTWTLETTVTPR